MRKPDYLNEQQVEQDYPFLRVKRLQAWRYLRRGGPRFLKIGRSVLYPREEIERFIQSSMVDTNDAR